MDTTVHEDQAESTNDGNEEPRPRIEELKQRMETLNHQVQGFIKEHPAACLMAALGLGYLFARMARRRS
jgi:hypothetical protein